MNYVALNKFIKLLVLYWKVLRFGEVNTQFWVLRQNKGLCFLTAIIGRGGSFKITELMATSGNNGSASAMLIFSVCFPSLIF